MAREIKAVVKSNIMVEDARIGFRNFSGKEGKYNAAGIRNFCVFLDTEFAEELEADGWNIRWLDPKDDQEEKQAYLQVAVKFDSENPGRSPKILLISRKGKTIIDEDSAAILDWAEIASVDLIIRPYNWDVNGKGGVKAYLKSMYITIVEDEFESKYYDVPDSAHEAIGGCGNCDACDGHCNCHDKD